MMAMMCAVNVQAQEPYTVYDETASKLTYYYDTDKVQRGGKALGEESEMSEIRVAEFDASFANYKDLTSTAFWFMGCVKLKEIIGIEYLNTENVTEMNEMFNACAKLTKLDLSHFKMDKVENMGSMFWGCYNLEELNISGWNTKSATSMFGLFAQCPKLTDLDLSGFDTRNVTTMAFMFNGDKGLTHLDLSGWSTENLQTTHFMFSDCENLETLDLSGWNTPNMTELFNMFSSCKMLTTIYVDSGWTVEKSLTEQGTLNMFFDCYSLVGGQGTCYDGEHLDNTYACIDGGASAPGYLTFKEYVGIQRVTTDDQKSQTVYSLSGQRLTAPRKGVNIIGGRKVLVK